MERLALMPDGTETYLYKDYSAQGVEISGGEAQKIALARALYKDAPFIVLDEPTAALDPMSEYEVYSKFNELSGERTAIYISHRLASCRFCDSVVVMKKASAPHALAYGTKAVASAVPPKLDENHMVSNPLSRRIKAATFRHYPRETEH